jgi:hypothetical protein
VKLYKNARKALEKQKKLYAISGTEEDMEDEDLHIPSETRIGKKLSDLTIKRVIFLVLLLLLILPLFEAEFYVEPLHSWDFGLSALAKYLGTSSYHIAREAYIDYHEDRRRPLIYMSIEISDDVTYTWEEIDP